MNSKEKIHYSVCIQTPGIVKVEVDKRLGRYPFYVFVRGFLLPEQPAKLDVCGRYQPYREAHFEDVCVSAEGGDGTPLLISSDAKVVCGIEAVEALKENRDLKGHWSDEYDYT